MNQFTSDANNLLKRLTQHQAVGDFTTLLNSMFAHDEDPTVIMSKLEHHLYERSCDVPVGIFVGSTSQLQVLGPTLKDFPASVKLLKLCQRILQVGRGRGKAIIIIDDTPLGDEEVQAAIVISAPPTEFTSTPEPASFQIGEPPSMPEPVDTHVVRQSVDKANMLMALDSLRATTQENLRLIDRMRDELEST